MFKSIPLIVLAASFLSLMGCEEPSRSSGSKLKPAVTPPSAPATSTSTNPPPAQTSNTPATPPPSTPSPTQQTPAPTPQMPIILKVGVALAQTGPDGTMMMFSVDYEFVQGEPNSSGYVWVIERAKGTPVKIEVKLASKGNLPTGINQWRPEDGPFQSHIENQNGNRLSESIEMR